MGVLQRFERRIEELVNGAFAKAFRSDVQPVEIAAALQRECDGKAAIVARGRTLAPNVFRVELGPQDFERLSVHEAALATELATMVAEHATTQGYTMLGVAAVGFEEADDLERGMFRVRSETMANVETANPRPSSGGGSREAGPRSSPAPAPAAQSGPHGGPAGGPSAGPAVSPAVGPAVGPEPTLFIARDELQRRQADDDAARRDSAVRPPELEIAGQRIPLTRPGTVLGRGRDVDVRIDDPGVSRRHAEIRINAGAAEIVDLGSTNGILVNGRRRERAVLEDGATFQVGSTAVTYRLPDGTGSRG